MRRPLLAFASFALLLSASSSAAAAIPTCPAPPADAVAVAPAKADFVIAAQLPKLDAQPAGERVLGLAALDLQLGEWLRLRQACFSPDKAGAIQELSVAGNAAGEFVWLLRGEGVSSEDAVACVSDWFARRDEGKSPWLEVQTLGGECVRHYRSTSDRKMGAVAMQNHTLALVSAGWFDGVLAAIKDGQTRAADLEEAAKLARHPDAQIWGAGTLHREAGYLAQVPWRDTIRNLAMRAELSDGMSVRMAAETSDFGSALTRTVAAELPTLFGKWAELGVPKGLLAKLEVSKARELFLARWELDGRELRQLATSLRGVLQGGGLL
jgi:hypothetical protein